jgi:CBS domain-containing protein
MIVMASHGGTMMRPLAVMMKRNPRMISPEATLVEAATMMRDTRVGAILVGEHGTFIGIISEADLVRKAMASQVDPTQVRVRSVMSSPVITIEQDRSAHDASDLMAEKGIRHLAVTEDGRIVGIVTVRDLLRYFKNWGPH